jgi:hypothetical protein
LSRVSHKRGEELRFPLACIGIATFRRAFSPINYLLDAMMTCATAAVTTPAVVITRNKFLRFSQLEWSI